MRVKVGWRFQIALYDALRSIGVSRDKTVAVIEALEHDIELVYADTDAPSLERPFAPRNTGQMPTNDAGM